jgi:hypothetical protein
VLFSIQYLSGSVTFFISSWYDYSSRNNPIIFSCIQNSQLSFRIGQFLRSQMTLNKDMIIHMTYLMKYFLYATLFLKLFFCFRIRWIMVWLWTPIPFFHKCERGMFEWWTSASHKSYESTERGGDCGCCLKFAVAETKQFDEHANIHEDGSMEMELLSSCIFSKLLSL